MKVLKRDFRSGEVRVLAESLDDLWYLSKVISPGDLAIARTFRSIAGKDDKLRSGKSEKRAMTLGIRVDSCEFDENSNRLRVLGIIKSGPDEYVSFGSHHTFELGEHSEIKIIKNNWADSEKGYLSDAEKKGKTARAIVCAVDKSSAVIALVRDRGLKFINLSENVGGKYAEGGTKDETEFFSKLKSAITSELEHEDAGTVYLCGTGFTKGNFAKFCDSTGKKFNCQVIDSGNDGKQAVYELIRTGKLDRAIGDSRINRESGLIERVFYEISKDGLFAYGKRDVKSACESGAVLELLVLDSLLRKDASVERLIENTRKSRGNFCVFDSRHEPGERLNGLGGLAAILRYKI